MGDFRLSKVSIRSKGTITEISINGVPVEKNALHFRLEQDGGEYPRLLLTILVDELDLECDAEVEKSRVSG